MRNKNSLHLFFTGYIQVFFVSLNLCFLINRMYIGVLLASFMISFIWSFNVKKIVFGSTLDRVSYSLGAAFGSLSGIWSESFITAIL
jgi:hypothetical protein